MWKIYISVYYCAGTSYWVYKKTFFFPNNGTIFIALVFFLQLSTKVYKHWQKLLEISGNCNFRTNPNNNKTALCVKQLTWKRKEKDDWIHQVKQCRFLAQRPLAHQSSVLCSAPWLWVLRRGAHRQAASVPVNAAVTQWDRCENACFTGLKERR